MPETRTQTYPGDRRNADRDTFIGSGGRFFRVVGEPVYDPAADSTVITYERVPMDEMGSRYGHLIDQAVDRLTLSELFGGEI